MKTLTSLLTLSAALALPLAATAAGAGVDYPQGYRHWAHVKSLILEPGHPLYAAFGGLHHIYANERAMKGYRDGKFPDC